VIDPGYDPLHTPVLIGFKNGIYEMVTVHGHPRLQHVQSGSIHRMSAVFTGAQRPIFPIDGKDRASHSMRESRTR
jgi:hypothetical protein